MGERSDQPRIRAPGVTPEAVDRVPWDAWSTVVLARVLRRPADFARIDVDALARRIVAENGLQPLVGEDGAALPGRLFRRP